VFQEAEIEWKAWPVQVVRKLKDLGVLMLRLSLRVLLMEAGAGQGRTDVAFQVEGWIAPAGVDNANGHPRNAPLAATNQHSLLIVSCGSREDR
jgi:hypothetical protein